MEPDLDQERDFGGTARIRDVVVPGNVITVEVLPSGASDLVEQPAW